MRIVQQASSAILEVDHPMSELEQRRIKAELQAIGIAAVILPMGVSLASMAQCDLADTEETH